MINLGPGDTEKISLIDEFLQIVSYEELRSIVEKDLVAGKLRGVDTEKIGIVRQLIESHNNLEIENMMLRSRIGVLEDDLRTLIRCMARSSYDASATSDFSYLKNKYTTY